ncbi:hypothetical protein ACLMAL_32390 [Nocardia sp. CWNU-33]|uniref:hypothetical protein n=1 Tax=Nocardia sp. CWNU-33 TaxID=3392117 RepID=UPI00398E6607
MYEWNQLVAGVWHETLGSFEIVLRNALDTQLIVFHQRARNGNGDWYTDPNMPWITNTRLMKAIQTARNRATLNGTIPEVHGKVVAEVTFGFWRYTLANTYQTTLRAPAYRRAFPRLRPQSRISVYDPFSRPRKPQAPGLRSKVLSKRSFADNPCSDFERALCGS